MNESNDFQRWCALCYYYVQLCTHYIWRTFFYGLVHVTAYIALLDERYFIRIHKHFANSNAIRFVRTWYIRLLHSVCLVYALVTISIPIYSYMNKYNRKKQSMQYMIVVEFTHQSYMHFCSCCHFVCTFENEIKIKK